jgi:hypothetical protein
MALAYLLDEHFRGPLWNAIQRHNARSSDTIDAVRVGDADGPPLGMDDPAILRWAERTGRILITFNEHTMPDHLADHLRGGGHSPGIFSVRPGIQLAEIVEFLVLAALASEQAEWQDRIVYVP